MGTMGTLRAVAGEEPHLWRGNRGDRGGTQAGALLLAGLGDDAEWPAADASVAAAPLDRVGLAGAEASVGDGVVSSAQRRCLLGAPGVTSDREFRLVLHVARSLQRAPDDGRDHLSSEALLAFCRSRSPGMTSTFIGDSPKNRMNTGRTHRTEKPATCIPRKRRSSRRWSITWYRRTSTCPRAPTWGSISISTARSLAAGAKAIGCTSKGHGNRVCRARVINCR